MVMLYIICIISYPIYMFNIHIMSLYEPVNIIMIDGDHDRFLKIKIFSTSFKAIFL